MVFKAKIADSSRVGVHAMVTFFDQNEDTYQALKVGDRLRLLNSVPAANSSSDSYLNLNMIKNSKIFHVTDSVLKPRKCTEIIERCKSMVEHSLTFSEYKRRFSEIKKDNDVTFYGYILKVISSKNATNSE